MTVQGRAVLVTGASRGFGRAMAKAFLDAGAHVIGVGRDPEAMGEAHEIFARTGGTFEMVTCDVRDEDAVVQCISGLDQIDVLVNNAGIARGGPFLETPTEELREILDINVIGAFVVMREVVRKMVGSGGGLVVNIASDAAVKGIAGMAPYVSSKHALLGMGRSVREEHRGDGIRVTTYCPGGISTDIFGPGTASPHAMPPDALAETIVHIASLPQIVEVPELLVQPMPMR